MFVDFCMMITTFVEHFDDSTKVFYMFVCVCGGGGGGACMDFCMVIITSLEHYDDLDSAKVDVCHCVGVGGCMYVDL